MSFKHLLAEPPIRWYGSKPWCPAHTNSQLRFMAIHSPKILQKYPKYMAGWWYTYPSEKYEFVSWADYSQYMEKITNVPNHQPDLGQLIKLVGFDPCPTQSSSDFGVYRWPQGATKTPCPLPHLVPLVPGPHSCRTLGAWTCLLCNACATGSIPNISQYSLYVYYIVYIYIYYIYICHTCKEFSQWLVVWGLFENFPRFATVNLTFYDFL